MILACSSIISVCCRYTMSLVCSYVLCSIRKNRTETMKQPRKNTASIRHQSIGQSFISCLLKTQSRPSSGRFHCWLPTTPSDQIQVAVLCLPPGCLLLRALTDYLDFTPHGRQVIRRACIPPTW